MVGTSDAFRLFCDFGPGRDSCKWRLRSQPLVFEGVSDLILDLESVHAHVQASEGKTQSGVSLEECFLECIVCCQVPPRQLLYQEPEKTWNGNVQTNVRTNSSEQCNGNMHENVGFRGKKGQKVHPNCATNIAMILNYTILSAPPDF